MLVRKTHKVHYFYNYLANRVLSFLNNMVTNLFLSDVETAAKAFNGKILRSVNIVSNGFEIRRILPYDFFPQTHHVECLVLAEGRR